MSDSAFKHYFDRNAVRTLVERIRSVHARFDAARFESLATRDLDALEMTARVKLFSAALRETLPSDPKRALRVLEDSLPPPLDETGEGPLTGGFLLWPYGQFVGDYGLSEFDASMDFMTALTQRFTSEFAVRPFLVRYQDEALARLRSLTTHPSAHVRRWCSEGSRPRLPWGLRLQQFVSDPSPLWPILESLRDDASLYVRKSVANSVNDIAKDHPQLAVARMAEWSRDASSPRRWVIRHALRTRIKAGDPKALKLLGYSASKGVSASLRVSPKRVAIGESVALSATLTNATSRKVALVVDYVVHHVTASGKTSPKVFKWTSARLGPGESVTLTKTHPLRPTTVRKLMPGDHRIALQVSGAVLAEGVTKLVRA